MSKEQQPEALRLAGLLRIESDSEVGVVKYSTAKKSEQELRRLYVENEALKRELIKEAARTAAEKRRADQMSLQHSMQAALNRDAREKLARYAAAEIADTAKQWGSA